MPQPSIAIHSSQVFIDGAWITPRGSRSLDLVNPATEKPITAIALGNEADVDLAVAAARRAFDGFSQTSREERLGLLTRIVEVYRRRAEDLAQAVTLEMGAPIGLARQAQVASGLGHLTRMVEVLGSYDFDEPFGSSTLVTREPIGVCGLITPWNWPLNQIACKVAPALAAGCAMVLKPSEVAPLSALVFAEVLAESGVPRGVFNLVNGDGMTVGQAIARHPGIDMISFTGSTRAGVGVAKAAADSVKRVSLELGGKSPNILLEDAHLPEAVTHAVEAAFRNSGQSCNAPTRLLVPAALLDEVVEIARGVAGRIVVGDPFSENSTIGPVVSRTQFDRIQALIDTGIREGARLVAGGPGRPAGLDRGYYVRPTIFAGVSRDMTIAREEIFGPVLVILTYRDEEEAVAIANDTPYGLSSYVSSADPDRARRIARRIRAGMVHINGARADNGAPFGGYKMSGNGREWGRYGFEEFLEVKSMFGFRSE